MPRPLLPSRPARVRTAAAIGLVLVALAVAVLPCPTATAPSAAGPAAAPAAGAVPFVIAAANLSWTSVPVGGVTSPLLRSDGGLAYDAADGYALLFGGTNHHLGLLGDTWKYEGGSWTNLTTSLPIAPGPRSGAALAYDASDGDAVLFGGLGPSGPLNDTWTFSAGAWHADTAPGPGPPARWGAAVAYDAPAQAIVLFGGTAENGSVLGDTWTFSAGAWHEIAATAAVPAPRAGASLAADPWDNGVVLFGGANATGAFLNDTWTFSAGTWTDRTATAGTGPTARSNTTLTYDPSRSATLLFGGWDGTSLADTWALVEGRWSSMTPVLPTSPGPRYGAAATYDALDGYLLLFGGNIGTGHFSTWVLLGPLSATIDGPPGSIAPGVPVGFTAVLVGGLPPFNETWEFSDANGTLPGAAATHTFARAGSYAVSVQVVDAAAETVTATLTVAVGYAPLNVTIAPAPTSPSVGGSVRFSAVVTGGVAPFTYAWSAPAGPCPASTGAVLACSDVPAGILEVSVSVTDASGQAASAGTGLSVGAAGGIAASPATSSGARTISGWTLWGSVGAVLATGIGLALVTYAWGRRRLHRELSQRPHCYAVPAWSETPAEFRPPEP
ncbi:MAG TPA: kelch repeat-containing protein [Thermoplasmata archaeon]|nr:kelch repeat-containing protein [Thermoplasmata archaeon]